MTTVLPNHNHGLHSKSGIVQRQHPVPCPNPIISATIVFLNIPEQYMGRRSNLAIEGGLTSEQTLTSGWEGSSHPALGVDTFHHPPLEEERRNHIPCMHGAVDTRDHFV